MQNYRVAQSVFYTEIYPLCTKVVPLYLPPHQITHWFSKTQRMALGCLKPVHELKPHVACVSSGLRTSVCSYLISATHKAQPYVAIKVPFNCSTWEQPKLKKQPLGIEDSHKLLFINAENVESFALLILAGTNTEVRQIRFRTAPLPDQDEKKQPTLACM